MKDKKINSLKLDERQKDKQLKVRLYLFRIWTRFWKQGVPPEPETERNIISPKL